MGTHQTFRQDRMRRNPRPLGQGGSQIFTHAAYHFGYTQAHAFFGEKSIQLGVKYTESASLSFSKITKPTLFCPISRRNPAISQGIMFNASTVV